MKYFYTLIVSLLVTTSLFSQKVNYDNDSRWFWGLNVGATWTKTDVPHKLDLGYGLMLGHQFNYNYGKPISFDLRLRYLTGLWKGYNTDSTNVSANPVYNEYNTQGQPVVLNFGTRLHELSLELAIHLNKLRERTGWDPYIFGGIGYTWYRTKGDLQGSDGYTYLYDSTKLASSSYTQSEIHGLTDKKFETDLNSPASMGKFMPSVGIGIGYQVAKGVSLGIEHKTTFTMADNFDGHIQAKGKYANDWYHYTSFYLKFHIRSHYDHTTYQDTVSQPVVTNPDWTQANNKPPVVDITNPSVTGTTVNSSNYVIKGRIQNVNSSSNVIFRQNGNYISNFTFNPSTQEFQSIVTLVPGQNTFELTGTNDFGSDLDQTVINYVRETPTPPVVTYSNPSSNPTTVQNPIFNLVGTVLNVTGKDKITMTLNGNPAVFTYNTSTRGINATLNLATGSNIVSTTGTNQYGSDTETATIIYQPQQTVQPPVVYFVNPNINPYTVNQNTFALTADVLNVADAQHVSFKQNGTINNNFAYNAQTDKFTSNVILNAGQNVFEVIGTNAAGSASATTIIIYNRIAPKPPIVTITNPGTNPYETSSSVFNLNATVLNVTQKSQVKVTLNGTNLPNFVYNAASNGVTEPLNLVTGANVVTVTGTNTDGTDSRQTTIIYKPAATIQPPVVQFTNPNVDPYTTSNGTHNVVASVLHVTTQSGVNVNVNGTNVTTFTFVNSAASFPVTLIEGANIITVTGTNSAGTASETQTIIYRKPVAVQPPIVSFIDPSLNPAVSLNATYLVKARVRFVTAANQIVLKINGQTTTNFIYTASSELMEFTTGLVNGANVIEITATNAAGSDAETTVINYRAPNPTLPPVVTITYPAANPQTVNVPNSNVAATVLNVDNQQQIQVLVNGAPYSGFTYSTSTKVLTMNVSLILGANSVTITATNTAGTASDATQIIYKRDEVINPPLVTFINPASPGQTVSSAAYVMKGHVTNVTNQSQIVLKEDGLIVNPSFWTFDPATLEVTFNHTLNAGNNIFEITGTNAGGSHTASTSIIFKRIEVPCNKPVITFNNPATQNTSVENAQFTLKGIVTNITSVNQIEVYLNGSLQAAGSLNTSTLEFEKVLTLIEGSNSIEIKASNSCGVSTSTTVVIMKPKVIPCFAPEITRLKPVSEEMITEAESVSIAATANNITQVSQIQCKLDGVIVPFNYDEVSHTVTSTVALTEGAHTITVYVRNECGTKQLVWKVTRAVCRPPVVTITSSSTPNGSSVTSDGFNLSGTVSNVESQSDITVTQNGQVIGFVYNQQTGVITVDRNLVFGPNAFVILAKNKCGENSKAINVLRNEVITVPPPTIQITSPSMTPLETDQSAQTIQIMTTGVTSASQVSVTLNGVATNFEYKSSGGVRFNASFVIGENVILATAVTPGGTAVDTKTVIYNAPEVIPAPVITMKNPSRCPATFQVGSITMSGTVQNVSNASQVSILYNGANVEFTSSIESNVLTYSFVVNVTLSTVSAPLVVTATNASGTDTKSCLINAAQPSGTNGTGNGNEGGSTGGEGTDEKVKTEPVRPLKPGTVVEPTTKPTTPATNPGRPVVRP
ncbi:Ig-like domain-containing protein [Fluviicola taffensis]|uniref:Ig-like domain-containing protein n=1 Tax=Fluviicola taffensis TaxID=191579 RepID=UPI0031379974